MSARGIRPHERGASPQRLRRGRSAAENLIAALRCLYKRAEDEFLAREVEYHLSRTVMLRKFTTHQCNPGSSRN